MKKILKVTSILGVASLVKIFTGFVRAKFLAWRLGPGGIGLISQAQMYSAYAIQLCSLNMGLGITKDVSEKLARKEEKSISVTVNTASTFQLLAALILSACALPFTMPLTRLLFSDQKYWIFFLGITITAPFAAFLSGVVEPVFYGYRKIADNTKLIILFILTSLALLIGLVYFFGIKGMLIQIILTGIAGFTLSYIFLSRKTSVRPALNLRLFTDKNSRATLIQLLKYGLITFIPANVNMLIALYLRSLFMRQYGIEANGFYQVAYAMSAYYLPFVMNAVWGHFYPEMCVLKDNAGINRLLNQFIRFSLFTTCGIAALCIIFRRFAILLLYSAKFMPAYDLLAIQSLGDVFFVLFCVFSTSLMARKKFKGVIFISTVGYNAALLTIYFFLTNQGGLDFRNLSAAIALTNIIIVSVLILYHRFDTGFTLSIDNVWLLMKSAGFLVMVLVLPEGGISMIALKLAIIFVWFVLSATREEVGKLKGYALRFIKRE